MIKKISPITRFEIISLHGDRDIFMDFSDPVKILVSENGAGKTTVLNALYNVLSGNWDKLTRLEFESMSVYFSNDEHIKIEHSSLVQTSSDSKKTILSFLSSHFSAAEIDRMHMFAIQNSISDFKKRYESTLERIGVPSRVVYSELSFGQALKPHRRNLIRRFQENLDKIKKAFPYPILYFPTYRRVEEDLQNLGYLEKDLELNRNEKLIQFGMQDVKRSFDRITSEIRKSSVEWYSIINGRMLTQLIDGIKPESISFDSMKNPEALRIVLDRVGENITKKDKDHILQIIKSGNIKKNQYAPLAYFLSNLIQVYDQQRRNDNAIKSFARVVNSYLVNKSIDDKEVLYNESKVDIQIINTRTGKEMPLDRLSSGEKQVISIFSRLYLDESSPYAIVFDEPELSLSIEWQKKLLQDIVDSEQCIFLLAATHSPFIFENDLDEFASALNIKLKEPA